MSMDQSFRSEDEAKTGRRGSTWGRMGSFEVAIYQDGTLMLDPQDSECGITLAELREIVQTAKDFLAWKLHQKELRNSSNNRQNDRGCRYSHLIDTES